MEDAVRREMVALSNTLVRLEKETEKARKSVKMYHDILLRKKDALADSLGILAEGYKRHGELLKQLREFQG